MGMGKKDENDVIEIVNKNFSDISNVYNSDHYHSQTYII